MRVLKQVLPAAALLLAVAPWAAGQVGPGVHHTRVQYMRGAGPAGPAAAANPQNIPYLGGAVLPNTTTYAIWWGKPSDFPSDAPEGLDDFLEGLGGSPYLGLANEYLFGQEAHTRFGGNLFDDSAPPSIAFSPATGEDFIAEEVPKVLSNNRQKPDPTAIYVVYTSNFPTDSSYCAYHDYLVTADGTSIHVVYAPNSTSALSGCGTEFDPFYTPNNHSEGTRAMANVTAHELMETRRVVRPFNWE